MSRFRQLAARMIEDHALLTVMLELTYRCNLDCSFCYNDLSLRGRPVATDDYLRLLDELAEMQVLNLVLTGGEPLASPSFWTVGARARELGFVVRVKSNGHALRDPVARRLKDEVDPYIVETSLHGSDAATHDRQTRVAGSFARLLENLETMRRVGLRVKLNSTLTRWNEDQVEAMLAIADRLGMELAFDPVVTPRDDGDRSPLDLSASEDGVRRLYATVRRRAAAAAARGARPAVEVGRHNDIQSDVGLPGVAAGTAPKKSCGAGSATLTVDPFGNVYPCVQWRRAVGNVHDAPIRAIWDGRALDAVRDTNRRAGEMLDALGPDGRQIGFCMGMAQELAGDPLAMYPQAARNLAIIGGSQPASDDGGGRRTLLPVYGQD